MAWHNKSKRICSNQEDTRAVQTQKTLLLHTFKQSIHALPSISSTAQLSGSSLSAEFTGRSVIRGRLP